MFCRSSEASNGQIASEAQVPLISSGLGKIGVTRSGGMRRRFFAIQQALAEALRTLAPGGVLVISCLASGLLWEVSGPGLWESGARYLTTRDGSKVDVDMQICSKSACRFQLNQPWHLLLCLTLQKHGQSWAVIVNFRQVWPAMRTDTISTSLWVSSVSGYPTPGVRIFLWSVEKNQIRGLLSIHLTTIFVMILDHLEWLDWTNCHKLVSNVYPCHYSFRCSSLRFCLTLSNEVEAFQRL